MSAVDLFGAPAVAAASLVLTLGIYHAARRLFQRHPRIWLTPIIVTPLVLLVLLLGSGTPYEVYYTHTRWLTWMLGPATVAFAYPIHQQRGLIRRYPITLSIGVLTGVVLGVGSSWVLAWVLGLPDEVMRNILPRSVSSPFAMPVAIMLGVQPELAVMCVLVTGVFGMVVGHGWLTWLNVSHPVAVGSAFGAATHGVGTAKAWQIGPEQGAVSSLTMIFSGIVLVLIGPLLARALA
ncbi:LrgB family protein [uncultured Aquabacterium sp.]|jgi:putative effector of murein hydrolase|uniref:LrgB family protein n=1 Tax=uncultured Aquabacterium sp. TaxID=158753 RepID=UPI00261EDEF3|nr:LrgB family protein [uncultured Aquabacterium sp.]